MDSLLTPEEWLKTNNGLFPTKYLAMQGYSNYVISKQPKKEIILPEYDVTRSMTATGWNRAIDKVKELNNLQ